MITRVLAACLLIASSAISGAEPARKWSNTDGTRTFTGKFVERDAATVTVSLIPGGKKTTLPLTKLHAKDIAWLNQNHPHEQEPVITPAVVSDPVFGPVCLGDSHATVLEKLKTCALVEPTIPIAMMGRTGLNNAFKTKQAMGKLHFFLFFEWDESNRLKEIILHSEPKPANAIPTAITPCRNTVMENLTQQHGPPIAGNPKFDPSSIPVGGILYTHVWRLKPQLTLMLGAAHDEDGFRVSMRYTSETR